MTFATDTARLLFHQLPTEIQVNYTEWEAKLAVKQQLMQIDAVMRFGSVLEVSLRITENLDPVTV